MRTEFNNLVELMNRYDLYQKNDEVGIALNNLEQKIIEVEKRIECARRSNQDSNSVIMTLVESYQDQGKTKEILTYGDFEVLQRNVYDIDIALNFNDKEPIENNWYQLFEEPKQEEPKVLIPKGSIVEWKPKIPTYSAEGGAIAKVTKDYTNKCEFLFVEFLDKKVSGLENGGYPEIQFNVISTPIDLSEPIKEEVEISHDEKINNYDNIVKNVIDTLNEINVDGETMQYILEQVGMSEQIHRQLVMKNDYKVTKDLMREKFELEL